MRKLLNVAAIFMTAFASLVAYGQGSASQLTPEQKAGMAAIEQMEQQQLASLYAAISNNAATASARQIKTSGGFSPMGLIKTASHSDGIKFNKVVIDPYVTYGIAPVGNWYTFNHPTQYYPWVQETRTLVFSNGPAMSSYFQSQMPACAVSYMYAIATNHFDQYGDPVWHTFSAWYQANGSLAALYNQAFRCSFGDYVNNGGGSTNLPMTNNWSRFTMMVPPFVGASNKMYFAQFVGSQQFGASPEGQVDNSVQWMPYQPDYVGISCQTDNSNNMTLNWDIYYQMTNHFYLASSTNLVSPWVSNTVPITVSNNIGSIKFAEADSQRYFTLIHY